MDALLTRLRRTGRTQRMLRDAVDTFLSGKDVVILAGNVANQRDLWTRLCRMLPEARSTSTLEIKGAQGNTIATVLTSNWVNPETGKVLGSDAVAFADHHAVEAAYGWALQQWFKYSNPFTEGEDR